MLFLLPSAPTPSELDRILASPQLDGAVVAAIVTDLDGKVLYEHNSSTHVVPASNQKLLSASFALWELGPDYRPKTRFWKLHDRVVIDAPGDPLMTYAELKKASEQLHLRGHNTVYIHEAYAPEIPDSWEIDDLPNRFSAPVSALTFDQGGFEAWSKGGKATLVPEPFGVHIETVASPGKPTVSYDPFSRRVTITGTLPKKDQLLDTLALPRSDEAAASIFGVGLHQTSDVPAGEPDLTITGGSTQDMLAACLPPSDNNIAENLLLLGARKEGELGAQPYSLARKRLVNFLTHVVGVMPQDVHPYDGSGLSRHDYVTTRAIAKILCWSSAQPTSAFWHGALAAPGKGTLSNRLKGLTFQGKTGSLDMVASLSGYLTTKSGKQVVVSIILNEFACTPAEARGVEDRFILALANDIPNKS